jgi:hypothetical protein
MTARRMLTALIALLALTAASPATVAATWTAPTTLAGA